MLQQRSAIARNLVSFKIKNFFKLLFILNVHIFGSEDGCHTVRPAPKVKMLLFYQSKLIIRDQTIRTSTKNPPPSHAPLFVKMNNRSVV